LFALGSLLSFHGLTYKVFANFEGPHHVLAFHHGVFFNVAFEFSTFNGFVEHFIQGFCCAYVHSRFTSKV
jgi:hypothetical protein